ncbi:MAG: NAD(P)H-binding protein, partial [Acidobacteriota bacterium]|nr:NAD(P)H-binding protein [Acidobacteriota bacterium]
AAVRSREAEEQIRSRFSNLADVIRISYDDSSTLDAAFREASSAIHLAGILVERPDSSYEQANVESTRSVVEAAKRNGLEKLVLVSAIGADENSANRYYRTKGQAEALVRASGVRYTILRVPILLGSGTAGAAALRQHIRAGKARLIDGGRYRQQPLHVNDLARAALIAVTQIAVAENATLQMAGPRSLLERELVECAARSVGRPIRIRGVPKRVLSLALAIRERIAPRGFSRDALEVVAADTDIDPQCAAAKLGIELTSIDDMIRDSLR